MDFEFETTRTGLANAFAAAGAELLGYQPLVSTAVAPIPDTQPQKYAVAGTLTGILQMAGKMMGEDAAEKPTGDLTDEQIDELFTPVAHPPAPTTLRNIARTIERAAIAAYLARRPKEEQSSDLNEQQERTIDCMDWWAIAQNLPKYSELYAAHLERQAQAEKPKATFDALAMARRFLGWKLPKDFCPDAGISFTPYQDPLLRPIGTNLLNEDQAKAMFEHCLKGAMRPTDDDLWDQTLRDRDANAEWADKLAGAIAEHFNVDIGEHSNMNCPWAEALEVIECAAPVSQGGDASEGLEMLDDLISSIEKHGNYSKESTLNFLGQIRQCFAAPASQEGAHAELEVQTEEWSYSTDEERYHDPEPSRLAILQHALAEVEATDDGTSQFWIGRNVRFTGKGNAGAIIDGLKEQAYDECGEFADTYLEDVTPEEEAELESLVTNWARRVDRSNLWTVTNTEYFTIESAKAEIERLTPACAERIGDHG